MASEYEKRKMLWTIMINTFKKFKRKKRGL